MMTKEVIFLGTAGAVASKGRDNTSLLIKTRGDKILIDLPGSPVKKLAQLNLDFRKISNIFFTHSHPDHIYGIISLLHSQYRLKNKVHIFAHPKVIELVKTLRKIFGLEDTTKYPKVIYHKIKSNFKKPFYNSDELKASAFKVNHSPESLGFKFLFKELDKTLVFSGDSALSLNLIKEAHECDCLIHDCFSPERIFKKYPQLYKMHTSSLLLGKIAGDCQVKILVPIHFASEVKYSIKEIIREIKKSFLGKVVIPEDFMTLKLSA